ncbi:Cupredoxin [Sparassis latifolia]
MRFSALLAALLPIGAALANTILVKVGENGTLTYNPSSVNATVGDTIAFQFLAKNHTITQSTFASPCTNFTSANGTTGVDSGFQFVAANASAFPQFSFTVQNASAPLWFYCRQAGHCAAGMVFAVNPTAQKSFATFQAAANATGMNATASSAAPSHASSGASSPSASSTTKMNGANTVRTGSAAVLLTAAGTLAGLLL